MGGRVSEEGWFFHKCTHPIVFSQLWSSSCLVYVCVILSNPYSVFELFDLTKSMVVTSISLCVVQPFINDGRDRLVLLRVHSMHCVSLLLRLAWSMRG